MQISSCILYYADYIVQVILYTSCKLHCMDAFFSAILIENYADYAHNLLNYKVIY